MRRGYTTGLGALAVASCLVPNFELVDSFDDEGEAGSAGASMGGSSTGGEGGDDPGTGGSSGNGGSSGSSSGASGASGSGGQGGASGSAGKGGSSGKGGSAGMSGEAGAGGGCSTGLTDCDGECVDLESDGDNCGECGEACGGTLACLDGACEADCGTQLRCANSCCPNPPANATATCVSNTCGIECAANFHGCGSNPDACYPNTDVTHCGTSCLDCTQPNAAATCVQQGSQPAICGNTCLGMTFACPGVAGKPACGSWDFESATTEGWSIFNDQSPDVMAPPSAYDGTFLTRTSFHSTGQRALAAGYNGDGVVRFGLQFKVRLCPSGQAIDLAGRSLVLDLYAETATGSVPFDRTQGYSYFLAYNGNNTIVGQGDFSHAADEWVTATWEFFDPPDSFTPTDLVFFFRTINNTAWRGTVYIDNVRILNQ